MSALNKVIELGRLTRDPELKQTPSGVAVTSFTIAVNKIVKKGEHPESDFFDCVAWKTTAETIARYFKKGERILIVGSLQTRSWEKEGVKHKVYEIKVDEVNFIEKKSDGVGNTELAAQASYTKPETVSEFEEVTNPDDLPF